MHFFLKEFFWHPPRATSLHHRSPAIAGAAAASAVGIRRAPPSPLFFSTLDAARVRTRVEDVMPIATGIEREEIDAEIQGKKWFDMDAPVGPFGTKEAPAVIQSYYNKRVVGCPGGGEDEYADVWFLLEKGKPRECPVCTQYFTLAVIGGGNPDGHDDDHHHHH